MPTYFKPLRRKIGVVTLLMACVLAAGWVRSAKYWDCLDLNTKPWHYAVSSGASQLHLKRFRHLPNGRLLSYFEIKFTLTEDRQNVGIIGYFADDDGTIHFDPAAVSKLKWRWDWFGLNVSHGTTANGDRTEFIVPYAFIVIPLTLLSAWLLLSKPRAMKPAGTTNGTDKTRPDTDRNACDHLWQN